jgi:hypothetical protein
MPENQSHAPLLIKRFPKTPRTQSEASRLSGFQNKLPSSSFIDRSFHWVAGRAFRFSQCPSPLLFCLSFSTEYLAGLYIWWSPRWRASPKSGLHSAIASCPLILAMNLSISTSAQYVTLDNKIKCLSLAVFLATPPIKL